MPSIKRANDTTYLSATIASLAQQSTHAQHQQIVIIVFLADADHDFNNKTARLLQQQFKVHIQSGLLQILRVSASYYPKLRDLKRNFKDAAKRVQWRAKQVADYALLFNYASNQSQYYLQLEDDVIAAQNYVGKIKDFIVRKQRKHWVTLEFSELGFIGKLFRSRDLLQLADYMLMFYDEQPIDWLIKHFRLIKAQSQRYLAKRTLFQHMGEISSFNATTNELKDRYFSRKLRADLADNPEAKVKSSMIGSDKYGAQYAYMGLKDSYFWAREPTVGDSIALQFATPQNVTRIYVETGSDRHPGDYLKSGDVFVSDQELRIGSGDHKAVRCVNEQYIGTIKAGRGNITDVEAKYPREIFCLRLVVSQPQSHWILFSYIGIYLTDP